MDGKEWNIYIRKISSLKRSKMAKRVKVINGNALEVLKKLPDNIIDVFMTSPPYFNQRDYEVDGQLGNENDIEDYIYNLQEIFNEVKRVLKDTGSFFLNIGDKYINKSLQMIPERITLSMVSNGWVLRNKIVWYKPNHMPDSTADRLTNTWEPIYFFVKDTGKYYTQDYYSNIDSIRVEHKTKNKNETGFPNILTEKEYLDIQPKLNDFNNTKAKNYNGKFKKDDKINKGQSPGARKSLGISYSKQRVNQITKDLETEIIKYLRGHRLKNKITIKSIDESFGYKSTAGHWFRLDNGRSLPKPEDWNKLKLILSLDNIYDDIITKEHYILQTVKNHKAGKNPGDLWAIMLEKTSESHFAVFPEELPLRIIKAFCPENGIVLDCFAGSGTTGVAALKLNKKSILIELNKEFIQIINKRLEQFAEKT